MDRPEQVRILADYRRFWSVVTTVSRQPPSTWLRILATVTVEPLLSKTVDLVRQQHREGLIDYGVIDLNPRIVEATDHTVSIVDCQDASKSGTLDIETSMPRTVGSASMSFAGVMVIGEDGRWRLSVARFLPGTC